MTTLLITAKAPVPGRAKTRLAATVGPEVAAALASAALLDTIAACTTAVGAERCVLALAGSLDDAVGAEALRTALAGWRVTAQIGASFGERLVAAHAAVPGPVVQIGMDTPQVTPELLHRMAAGLATADAVLAPATDGGWWALALRDGRWAQPLADVPMSRPDTGERTRAALEAAGLRVVDGPPLTDVDVADDADEVAGAAPLTRFAQQWRAVLA